MDLKLHTSDLPVQFSISQENARLPRPEVHEMGLRTVALQCSSAERVVAGGWFAQWNFVNKWLFLWTYCKCNEIGDLGSGAKIQLRKIVLHEIELRKVSIYSHKELKIQWLISNLATSTFYNTHTTLRHRIIQILNSINWKFFPQFLYSFFQFFLVSILLTIFVYIEN